ncbi:hypothetical protein [Pseudomonas sp. S9]|uniref:hypothetical protein n=1 Tax=Pseudomonas sp. S9 TaxID=686578 RepID=UPI0002556F4F|nr:hypothetical protein [Pseudomonas sp. S9]
MADQYDRAKAQAARMLAPRSRGGKGLEMTLRHTVKGSYIPGGTANPDTVTDYQGSAFRDTYKLQDIDGSLIKAGDVKFLVSPVLLDETDTPEPVTQDKVIFDGDTYTVVGVVPWNYAGLAVGFEVQARK